MKILITICARGGSKGIPGKNIKLINGQPLISYSINTAKKFATGKDATIALSTDDLTIREEASKQGLSSDYLRPAELALDSSGKIDVIKHLLYYEEKKADISYDYVLDLDITSPLRTLDDLEIAFESIMNDKNAISLFSVNHAARNPYFNMVEKKENGYYSTIKNGAFLTRQSAPKVYDMNASFYFYKRNFFELNCNSAITEKSLIYIMPHICFDLDEIIDFEFMAFLLENNKLGFEI